MRTCVQPSYRTFFIWFSNKIVTPGRTSHMIKYCINQGLKPKLIIAFGVIVGMNKSMCSQITKVFKISVANFTLKYLSIPKCGAVVVFRGAFHHFLVHNLHVWFQITKVLELLYTQIAFVWSFSPGWKYKASNTNITFWVFIFIQVLQSRNKRLFSVLTLDSCMSEVWGL